MTRTGRAVAVVLVAALLPGCVREIRTKRRPYHRVPGTLELGPAGVTGEPVCTQVELTGGRYGRMRYEVELDLTPMRGPARPVFYVVDLVAGERTYRGYVTTRQPRRVPGTARWVLPADTFGELRTAAVAPEHGVGVQQFAVPLTRCALTVEEPSAAERADDGRLLPEADGEAVVIDPDGTVRSMRER